MQPTDLETAAAELTKVDGALTSDASAVARLALSVNSNRRRYLPDQERLRDLHRSITLTEWLLDDIADADNLPEAS